MYDVFQGCFYSVFIFVVVIMISRGETVCGMKLRTLCMIIGYFHLVSSVVDICCHLLTVGIVTNGFQCDVDGENLKKISNLHFLEPILLVLNLGTHGFYPFPHVIRNQYNTYVEYMGVSAAPKCYPGVLHVYVVDVLNFLINLIWLKFVVGYVKALHKRDHEMMKMFVSLAIVKLVMQMMYLGYYPFSFEGVLDFQTFWLLKILDIIIAFCLLMMIKKYANVLKAENEAPKVEKPPSYFECLIAGVRPTVATEPEKKEAVVNVEEVKKEETPTTL